MSDASEQLSATVLVVSRDSQILAILAEILSRARHPVLTSQAVADAWACLELGQIGLVVMDVISPSMTEIAFINALRTDPCIAEIPVLFLHRNDQIVPSFPEMKFKGEPGDLNRIREAWLALPCSAPAFVNTAERLLQVAQVHKTKKHKESHDRSDSNEKVDEISPDEAAAELLGRMQTNSEALRSRPMIFGGYLGAIDVPKILSMMEPMKLSGVLAIDDNKRNGAIYLVNGEVWHAELAGIEGRDALNLCFHIKAGSFTFRISSEIPKRTITQNTMSLLLEGMRQMDEARSIIRDIQEKRKLRQHGTQEIQSVLEEKPEERQI